MAQGDRLDTWKEIADYLDCDPRTCSRWEEKYGLPVHRLDAQSKSRVHAYRHELDEWLTMRCSGRSKIGSGTPARSRFLLWGLPILIATAALIVWIKIHPRPGPPVDFAIEGSRLEILDAQGRHLWAYETGRVNLYGKEYYRRLFQDKCFEEKTTGLPNLIIRDLDGDDRPEILFAVSTRNNLNSGILHCFDQRGRQLWTVNTQRTVQYSDDLITSYAYFKGFNTCDPNGDGRLEVVVVSAQTQFFPTRLQVFNHAGDPLGEYWNSGRIVDFIACDLDGDGHQEILICGINNEYRQAFLAALDIRDLSGGSPQMHEDYIGQGIGPGSHLRYALFPRNDVNRVRNKHDFAFRVDVHSNRRLTVLLASGSIYELDFDFQVRSVNFTSAYDAARSRLKQEGLIQGEADDAYRKVLKKGMLHHDGDRWIPTPVLCRPRAAPRQK